MLQMLGTLGVVYCSLLKDQRSMFNVQSDVRKSLEHISADRAWARFCLPGDDLSDRDGAAPSLV